MASKAEHEAPKLTAPKLNAPSAPDLASDWRGREPVLCLAGKGPLDEAASAMSAQLLGKHGLATRVAPYGAASRQNVDSLDVDGVVMVCVSYLEISGSPSGLHYLMRRLRQRLPNAKILVGLWPMNGDAVEDDRVRKVVAADLYASSLKEAVEACVNVAHAEASTVPTQRIDPDDDGRGLHEPPSAPREQAVASAP